MAEKKGIEALDETWNPVTGCAKVSQGCKNCFAEGFFARLATNQKTVYFGRRFTDVAVHPERLEDPLHWRKPRRVFVVSMADLFHPEVPDAFLLQVFQVMQQARPHTFELLTKRPERMLDFCQRLVVAAEGRLALAESPGEGVALPNLWLGVSAEDQETANARLPLLFQTPAALRFVVCEPLLGPVDLVPWLAGPEHLGWVVTGGETGEKARPVDTRWLRQLRDQCQPAGVPFFFNGWGATRYGQRLDGKVWREMPGRESGAGAEQEAQSQGSFSFD